MRTGIGRAPRNRTVTLTDGDVVRLRPRLLTEDSIGNGAGTVDRTVCADSLRVLPLLPQGLVDLLIVDPPYNLTKTFNGSVFRELPAAGYESWLHSWIGLLVPLLKPSASVYVCSEWRSSGVVQRVLQDYFRVQNRITWEREKGRGSQRNWKNCSEDIWFCTMSDDYLFNTDAVMQRRRVVAPYRDASGNPKDWKNTAEGVFRLTHPSNLWADISVPFWSMPENTDHPTQKPEKLIAKLILASSAPSDLVLDPFLGSGTTSVVARKLGRRYIGIERDEEYCLLAEKRLELAETDARIQGYSGGCFWDRNTTALQRKDRARPAAAPSDQPDLFERVP